jgi:conjugative relaxase-like TrwC/TraI family protein
MLSVGKLTGGAGSARYYEESVASGREDYYAGEGEALGEWLGAGAAQLGLDGVVTAGALERLLVDGAHPVTGEPLRSTRAAVQGFDLTFSCPKSVSVLQAIGDEGVRAAVVAAHTAAVRDARGRGRGGRLNEHAGGLVAAAYRHRISRAGDPQMHTHVLAANLAQGADGRWIALHAAPLYVHAKTASYLYPASLRLHLTRDLGVEWTRVRRGIAEIAGVPPAVIEHFSQRRAEIRAAMEERGMTGARAAQVAALQTRRAKDYTLAPVSVYERWHARAADHGFTREALSALIGGAQEAPIRAQQRAAARLLAGARKG